MVQKEGGDSFLLAAKTVVSEGVGMANDKAAAKYGEFLSQIPLMQAVPRTSLAMKLRRSVS